MVQQPLLDLSLALASSADGARCKRMTTSVRCAEEIWCLITVLCAENRLHCVLYVHHVPVGLLSLCCCVSHIYVPSALHEHTALVGVKPKLPLSVILNVCSRDQKF